jgi:hypothetical protein
LESPFSFNPSADYVSANEVLASSVRFRIFMLSHGLLQVKKDNQTKVNLVRKETESLLTVMMR